MVKPENKILSLEAQDRIIKACNEQKLQLSHLEDSVMIGWMKALDLTETDPCFIVQALAEYRDLAMELLKEKENNEWH